MQRYLKIGIIFLIILGGIVANQSGLITEDSIRSVLSDYPVLAPVIFITIYAVATTVFIPATPLSLLGGVVFGPLLGSIYIFVGAVLGSTLAFVVARFVLRDWVVKNLVNRFPAVQEYDGRLEKNGFVTVLILRLVPLFPFNGLNFLLGVTRVGLGAYILATCLGIIPGVITLSFLGGALASRNLWAIGFALLMYAGLASIGIIHNRLTNKSS